MDSRFQVTWAQCVSLRAWQRWVASRLKRHSGRMRHDQPSRPRHAVTCRQVAPIPPKTPADGIFAQGTIVVNYTEVHRPARLPARLLLQAFQLAASQTSQFTCCQKFWSQRMDHMPQGQEVPIRLHMATPHWGRFELRVCPLSDASLVTENKEFSEACLAAHPLYLAPKALQPGALPYKHLQMVATRAASMRQSEPRHPAAG